MRPTFLLDNSVVQRLRVSAALEEFERLCGEGRIAKCLPSLLEEGFSARGAGDHARLMADATRATILLPPAPEIVPIALGIQAALFRAGEGRAAGVTDLEIAATAIHHGDARPVVVVHYDTDFDHIAGVEPRLRARWIVPRGSVA